MVFITVTEEVGSEGRNDDQAKQVSQNSGFSLGQMMSELLSSRRSASMENKLMKQMGLLTDRATFPKGYQLQHT